MGRHGGGSSSDDSSSFESSDGFGSRGFGLKSRNIPFDESYNRSYYDSRNRYHSYYTTDRRFGTKSGWNKSAIGEFFYVTAILIILLWVIYPYGRKIQGDISRIFIEDRADILTSEEERLLTELFQEVYDKSGMPITLYTDDFSWKRSYSSIESYSEKLYYNISADEDAMIILFTLDKVFDSWEYDMYCGDDTIKCFSNVAFSKLLSNFHNALSSQNLTNALISSWNMVMDDLAQEIGVNTIFVVIFILLLYSVFLICKLREVISQNQAYKYFRDNPNKLSLEKISLGELSSDTAPTYGHSTNRMLRSKMMLTKICNSCGISNDGTEKICSFCGAVLDANGANTNE